MQRPWSVYASFSRHFCPVACPILIVKSKYHGRPLNSTGWVGDSQNTGTAIAYGTYFPNSPLS
jgi:hypothetical protein